MEKEFVHPNLHVILIHYPLALLIVGTLIEFFAFLWRRHSFRVAGRWMILLGALSAIPTSLSGVYALYDLANPSQAPQEWKTISAAGALNEGQWDYLTEHLQLQVFSTLLAVFVVVTWLACSDRWRSRLHLVFLALLLISVGVTIAGARHGGEAVYVHRAGIEPTTLPAAPTSSTTSPQREQSELIAKVMYYLPPIQMHVIMAGITAAIALVSLGLSIRRITRGQPVTQVDSIATALGPPPTLIGGDGPDLPLIEPEDIGVPYLPASRFWMLASLLALLTAGGGYFMLASGSNTWSPVELWNGIVREHVRQMAHVITGVTIAVIPIILAMLTRWAPRQKWLLAFFALILLVAIAFQVWLGILLMYDTRQGPLNHFN